MIQDMILILDLGGEDEALIAREIRALGVYSEIHPHDISPKTLRALPNVRGILLNGGPNRVVNGEPIDASEAVYESGLPLLALDHPARGGAETARWPEDGEARRALLRSFLFDTCGAKPNWNMEHFIADQVELLRRQIGDGRVLLALSGGVDSSVVAALLIRAVGSRLTCVHVNHGLLRKGEPEQVVSVFREKLGAHLIYVDAVDRFLDKLAGVSDPEQKRRIIGAEFIRVFEEEARRQEGISHLAQGTIYPDIIESGTKTRPAVKSHHNVGGLPEDLAFSLVEPLKMLFKDEVRACGLALGLPEDMVYRQPFPGPGLGVRCPGAITRDRLGAVRETDAILREEFGAAGLDKQVWQYFTVVPDFKSVGMREGRRDMGWPVILRAVNTVDAMTAAPVYPDWAVLERIGARILSEVPAINRVLYDFTPKPPATIEYE